MIQIGENAGQQCVAMSLCALIYGKIRWITSVDGMIQIMIVGNQLYSSLSLLARQSMLMLTELPGMVTVFERSSSLNTMKVTLVTYMVMPESRGITTVYATGYSICTLFSELQLIHNGGIIGVGIYSIEGGGYKVFDSHARDMYGNSHSEGTCVLLEVPSIHKSEILCQLIFLKVSVSAELK